MKTFTQAYKHAMNAMIRGRSYVHIVISSGANFFDFYGDTILSVKQTDDVDPLARRLPTETLEFTVSDYSGEYDPHNPHGMSDLIDVKSSVVLSFGFEVNGGIEWLESDSYFLNEKPIHAGDSATFKASRRLAFLTDTYYKGAFNTNKEAVSLRDKAIDVLTDAGLTSYEFDIPAALGNIKSNAPLPIASHKECLQLIAHAAGGKLYTKPDGKIAIKPFATPTEANGFVLARKAINKKTEKTTSLPAVSQISVKNYIYTQSAESVYPKFELGGDGLTDYRLEYDLLYDARVHTVEGLPGGTGDIAFANFYGRVGDLVVDAPYGNFKVTLIGDDVNINTEIKHVVLTEEGQPDAEDNPLVIDADRLLDVYSEYLPLQLTHSLDYRGNPELQCGDCILYETKYGALALALVLSHTIYFDGALSGTLVLKNISFTTEGELFDNSEKRVYDSDENAVYLAGATHTSEYSMEEMDAYVAFTRDEPAPPPLYTRLSYTGVQLDDALATYRFGIVEVNTKYDLPVVGNLNMLYITKEEHEIYRWDDDKVQYFCVGTDYRNIDVIKGVI